MIKVPFSIPSIDEKDINYVIKTLKSGWLAHGKENENFEKKFAKYIGSKYAVSLNSCTSALELALWANNIKDGEVLIPSFTWVSTANVVKLQNLKIRFIDINIDNWNIDINKLTNQISKKTKAIIIVNYAGLNCEMKKLKTICNNNNILLIEDCAESLGSTYIDKKSGSFGIGCFSFFPTKNITTCEGGMLTTNNFEIYKKIKALAAHGIISNTFQRHNFRSQNKWFRSADYAGRNFRMPNPLAALGVSQLLKLDKLNSLRIKIANVYLEELKNFDCVSYQIFDKKKTSRVYQMFPIIVKNLKKKEIINYLNDKGIAVSSHFDPPVHLQKPFYLKSNSKSLKNTEYVSKRVITLPIFPHMNNKQIEKTLFYFKKAIKLYC